MSRMSQVDDLLFAYARAVDARDPDGVAACFDTDGVMEAQAGVLARGRDEVRDYYERAFASAMLSSGISTHFMANVAVDRSADGTRADVDSDCLAVLLSADGARLALRGLHYRDLCRLVDGNRWVFAHRRHQLRWRTEAPAFGVDPAP